MESGWLHGAENLTISFYFKYQYFDTLMSFLNCFIVELSCSQKNRKTQNFFLLNRVLGVLKRRENTKKVGVEKIFLA
jgi:hypothetical protein